MINVDPNLAPANDLEAMAKAFERSGAYKVLRQLAPLASRAPPPGVRTRLGLFVDTETTGFDHARDEIIELALVPFTYGNFGEIYAIGEPFQQLRQPSKPTPPRSRRPPASTTPRSSANRSIRMQSLRSRRRRPWS